MTAPGACFSRLLLEELRRIRDTKPAAAELADVKAYLVGSQLP